MINIKIKLKHEIVEYGKYMENIKYIVKIIITPK